MPVVHAPETEYAKEMRKWESQYTQYGPPGRPYPQPLPYPTRMYKAERQKDGSRLFHGETAHDEHEQRNLESRGFVVGGQQAALDALEKIEFGHAELAANLNYQARRATAGNPHVAEEIAAAQDAHGAKHLPMVPETPIKKRGRPKKETVPE